MRPIRQGDKKITDAFHQFLFKRLLSGMASLGVVPTDLGPDQAVYVVTYIEVAPNAAPQSALLLKQYGAASCRVDGNLRFDVLQRSTPSNQFVYVAIWRDQTAFERHRDAPHTKEFSSAMQAHVIAPFDQRIHTGMAVGSPARPSAGAVFVATHVDVPPPFKDQCVASLRALVAASRKEAGAVRFEVFQQGNRPNHFTVVETWQDENAYNGHITALHTKKFRAELGPMTGALYDERTYRAL
jgi:quinol monooxygenase YgiN